MNLVEFQVKGSAAPQFSIKFSLFNEKEIKVFKDGERFICNVLSEKPMMDRIFYEIEDVDGTFTGTIDNKYFHKITDLKNHSKRYTLLKTKLHIVDKI